MSRSSRRFAAKRLLRTRSDAIKAVAVDGIPLADALFVVAIIIASLISIAVAAALLTGPAAPTTAVLEVPLGEFRFGAGASPSRTHIQFKAIALVGGSPDLQIEKAEVLGRHTARVSQAVEEAGRAASEQELLEPDLTGFRSRVCTRVNRALGAYLVDDVLLNDFRIWESPRLAQADKCLDWHDGI